METQIRQIRNALQVAIDAAIEAIRSDPESRRAIQTAVKQLLEWVNAPEPEGPGAQEFEAALEPSDAETVEGRVPEPVPFGAVSHTPNPTSRDIPAISLRPRCHGY